MSPPTIECSGQVGRPGPLGKQAKVSHLLRVLVQRRKAHDAAQVGRAAVTHCTLFRLLQGRTGDHALDGRVLTWV